MKKESKAVGKGNGKGVGAFCCDLILKGLDNESIAMAARKKFKSKTTPASVSWYRSTLKKEGRLK